MPDAHAATPFQDRFLPLAEVELIAGIARSTIYLWEKAGRFPRGIRLTSACVRWRLLDIVAWMDAVDGSERSGQRRIAVAANEL